MRKDAGYLCSLRLARQRAKQVIEGADGHIDRIIWSVRENGGQVPNKLLKEFPQKVDLCGMVIDSQGEIRGWFTPPIQANALIEVRGTFDLLAKAEINDLQDAIISNQDVHWAVVPVQDRLTF